MTTSIKTEGDNNPPITPHARYEINEDLGSTTLLDSNSIATRVIPKPFKIVKDPGGSFEVGSIKIVGGLDLMSSRKQQGINEMLRSFGLDSSSNGDDYGVEFHFNPLPGDIVGNESYALNVTDNGATIEAVEEPGLFYGKIHCTYCLL